MNTTKSIYTLLLCGLSIIAVSQTKRIAHKSHSGKAATFNRYSLDNFGEPDLSPRLDSVVKVPFKGVRIYRSNWFMKQTFVDTVTNHPHFNNPLIKADSLKKLYPGVKFIGFDKKSKKK